MISIIVLAFAHFCYSCGIANYNMINSKDQTIATFSGISITVNLLILILAIWCCTLTQM